MIEIVTSADNQKQGIQGVSNSLTRDGSQDGGSQTSSKDKQQEGRDAYTGAEAGVGRHLEWQ